MDAGRRARRATSAGTVPHMPVAARRAGRRARASAIRAASGSRSARSASMGQDGIADPFAAISAIPAATGAVRDMTGVRLEVPRVHRREVHRLRPVLDAVPRRGDPRAREQRGGRARRGDRRGDQRRRVRAPASGGQAWAQGDAAAARRRSRRSPVPAAFAAALRDGGRQAGLGRRAARRDRRGVRRGAARGWPSSRWRAPSRSSTPSKAKREGHAAACSRSPSIPRRARAATSAWPCAPTARWSPSSRTTPRSSTAAPQLGALEAAARHRRPLRQRLATSTRGSACSRRCCSRRTATARWWAATARAWAAARRPRCT